MWIKPHVVLMAAGVWLFTTWRLAATSPKPWRAVVIDLLGNVVGGLLVGGAGIAFLVATGTWAEFWHVISVWGPEYAALGRGELADRVKHELHWFPPWSLWLLPTLPLALLSMLDAVPWAGRSAANSTQPGPIGRVLPAWLWDREANAVARFTRATLAALWLVWAFQAFYIQREFVYAHLTETLLMFGLWASHRYAMPAIVILWILLMGGMWLIADSHPSFHAQLMTVAEDDGRTGNDDPDRERYLVRHPLFDTNRMQYWGDCWRFNLPDHERYVLWDRIKRIQGHEASPGWEELEEVAAFLRKQGVKDYEVIGWHDSPHAIYLTMHLRPGLRYMHTNTAMGISERAHNQVLSELDQCRGRVRFVLSDLKWAAQGETPERKSQILGPPASENDLLPAELGGHRDTFPFNQRAVFRSQGGLGRYVVHRVGQR